MAEQGCDSKSNLLCQSNNGLVMAKNILPSNGVRPNVIEQDWIPRFEINHLIPTGNPFLRYFFSNLYKVYSLFWERLIPAGCILIFKTSLDLSKFEINEGPGRGSYQLWQEHCSSNSASVWWESRNKSKYYT